VKTKDTYGAAAVADLLSLVMQPSPSVDDVATWSPHEREAASRWASESRTAAPDVGPSPPPSVLLRWASGALADTPVAVTPVADQRVVTSVRGELWEWLKAEVAAQGRPRSLVVREILEDARLDRRRATQDQVEAEAELDAARRALAESEAELEGLRARLLALADAPSHAISGRRPDR